MVNVWPSCKFKDQNLNISCTGLFLPKAVIKRYEVLRVYFVCLHPQKQNDVLFLLTQKYAAINRLYLDDLKTWVSETITPHKIYLSVSTEVHKSYIFIEKYMNIFLKTIIIFLPLSNFLKELTLIYIYITEIKKKLRTGIGVADAVVKSCIVTFLAHLS